MRAIINHPRLSMLQHTTTETSSRLHNQETKLHKISCRSMKLRMAEMRVSCRALHSFRCRTRPNLSIPARAKKANLVQEQATWSTKTIQVLSKRHHTQQGLVLVDYIKVLPRCCRLATLVAIDTSSNTTTYPVARAWMKLIKYISAKLAKSTLWYEIAGLGKHKSHSCTYRYIF